MLVKEYTSIKLGKEEFEKALGIKIKQMMKWEDNHLTLIIKEQTNTQKGLSINLKCQDIQDLFDIDSNVFDSAKFENEAFITKKERITYKGNINGFTKRKAKLLK